MQKVIFCKVTRDKCAINDFNYGSDQGWEQ